MYIGKYIYKGRHYERGLCSELVKSREPDKDYLTAAWLAQLGEHRSAEREVAGSNPGQTKT